MSHTSWTLFAGPHAEKRSWVQKCVILSPTGMLQTKHDLLKQTGICSPSNHASLKPGALCPEVTHTHTSCQPTNPLLSERHRPRPPRKLRYQKPRLRRQHTMNLHLQGVDRQHKPLSCAPLQAPAHPKSKLLSIMEPSGSM